MTSWNAANDFVKARNALSRPARDAFQGADPSASFDPARPGEPSPVTTGRTDLGVGYVGSGGAVGLPSRNPIGFAPSADPDRDLPSESRFHTEISFKRHSSTVSPRASSPSAGGSGDELELGSANPVRQLPVTEMEDRGSVEESQVETPLSSAADDATETKGEVHDEPAVEEPQLVEEPVGGTAEKTPFYRRELTFRRRKEDVAAETAIAPVGEQPVVDEPVLEEPVAQEPVVEEPFVEAPQLVEEPVAQESVVEEPQLVEEPVGGTDEKVPFYRRELTFRRRNPEVEAETAIASVVEEPVVDEPVLEEPVAEEPFVEEPVLEEPVAQEPIVEEPQMVEEPVAEEAVVDEPVLDEPVAEEPVVDEPAFDEPQAEVPAAHEPTPADPPVVDEPIAAEPLVEGKNRKHSGPPLVKRARKPGRGGRGKTVVGLKIGASQIAAAVVTEIDGRHELVQLARRPIDSGLVVDGEVRNADALAHQLRMLFEEHKLPKKGVRIGLASNRIGVRTFDIAGIDDETMFDNAVRFKAHEVLPVAQHESVLDYRVLEERPTEEGGSSRRILLVVAPRDQVDPYVQVAQMAGLRVAGLDLEALSLLRAFVDPKPFAARAADDTSTVIVSIGHESTTLLVAGGGACEFTRVFDWGGGTLQDAVMQELDVHQAEAATILRHLSLSGPGRRYEALDDAARARALETVRLGLTPFARELVSSLQFYQTQPDSLGIGEIVITGGTSHLEGLSEALHQMIGVNVRVGDPLARVNVSGELDSAIEATIGSMAVPIGLAIEDDRMRSVNLLPADVKATAGRRPNLVAIALPVAVAVPVAVLGFMFVSAHGQVGDSQAELDAVSAQIEALPRPQRPVLDASITGEQAQRAQAVANVLGSRVAWDAVLRDVSRVLPENVWLNSLQAQVAATAVAGSVPVAATATTGVPAAPTGALIDGFTYAQTDVARLLARLATLPTLDNVTLTSSKVEIKGAKPVVHFQIAADLNTGGS